jgi:bifunctional ADP-heptose synthase (sugar kinase/adenylyltransferase)
MRHEPLICREKLEHLLRQFSGLTIGVVGDLFLDRYLEIPPGLHELSVETQLEAHQVSRLRNTPGALGTVISNLAALDVGQIVPVTVLGDDGHGYDLRQQLSRLAVDTSSILCDPNRLTPTYIKPLKQDAAGNWCELNRLDVRTRGPLSEKTCQQVCQRLKQVHALADGLIVLDQVNEEDWGVVNGTVRHCLGELFKSNPDKLIMIDSRQCLSRFDFGVLKGNGSEITRAAGIKSPGPHAAIDAAQKLSRRTRNTVYCTLGGEGILVTRPGQNDEKVPGYPPRGSVDTVGAGDSATSGIVASRLAGATEVEAAVVGNLVASVTVQQLETTGVADPVQVLSRWEQVSMQ